MSSSQRKRRFVVTTWEQVEGTYLVTADSEDEARAKFKQQRGRMIDWDGVEQTNYMAFKVDIESVKSDA